MNPKERFQPLLLELFTEMKEEFEEMKEKGLDRKDISEEDVVTEVDTRMTELVVSFFSDQEEKYRLVSEEMKKEGGSQGSSNPDYTVIFDDIDGTANMRDYAGPFGSIIGIAKGDNPDFKDTLATGFLELTRGIFYHAYRGEGAFRRKGLNGKDSRLETSDEEELKVQTGLLVDQVMLTERAEIAEEAWKSWCNDFGCMGHHFALIAEGVREGFVTGGHGLFKDKNTAEELAGMHLLVKEANGVVVDWSCEEISENRIGMEEGDNHDIVVASTEELAEKICTKIL